jgi:hypothetical protein
MMNRDAPHFRTNSRTGASLYASPFDHITWFYPRPLKRVRNASRHIIYLEAGRTPQGFGYLASYRSVTPSQPDILRFDHRRRTSMTVGFADGRADQLDRSEILLRPGEDVDGPARIREYWYGSSQYTGVQQIDWQ